MCANFGVCFRKWTILLKFAVICSTISRERIGTHRNTKEKQTATGLLVLTRLFVIETTLSNLEWRIQDSKSEDFSHQPRLVGKKGEPCNMKKIEWKCFRQDRFYPLVLIIAVYVWPIYLLCHLDITLSYHKALQTPVIHFVRIRWRIHFLL